MHRSNCFNYTAHDRATINAINRSNIRAHNCNPINSDLAHAYSATTTQQSDGCWCHSRRDKNVSNSDTNVAGSCKWSCNLHCQVLHSTRGGEHPTRRGHWGGNQWYIHHPDCTGERHHLLHLGGGRVRGRGGATQWQDERSNIWQWVGQTLIVHKLTAHASELIAEAMGVTLLLNNE